MELAQFSSPIVYFDMPNEDDPLPSKWGLFVVSQLRLLHSLRCHNKLPHENLKKQDKNEVLVGEQAGGPGGPTDNVFLKNEIFLKKSAIKCSLVGIQNDFFCLKNEKWNPLEPQRQNCF